MIFGSFFTWNTLKAPSQLEVELVDELVKTMCLAWASSKFDHPNHAQNSYAKHVTGVVAQGYEELDVIKQWVQYVESASTRAIS